MRPLDAWSVKEDCSGACVLGAVRTTHGLAVLLDNGAALVVERGWTAAPEEAAAFREAARARLAREAAELAAIAPREQTARQQAQDMRRERDIAQVVFGDGYDIIGLGMSDVERRARTERIAREEER